MKLLNISNVNIIKCINQVSQQSGNDLKKVENILTREYDLPKNAIEYFSKDGLKFYITNAIVVSKRPIVTLCVYRNNKYVNTIQIYKSLSDVGAWRFRRI